jgi:protein deglycase
MEVIMKKKALVVLAEGFEEIEAVLPVDVLRRAEIDVTVAGLTGISVTGAHGLTIEADMLFDEYMGIPDAIILPGGMPGAENLAGSPRLRALILSVDSGKKLVAAICASPALVLGPAGVLKNRMATCYPGLESNFPGDVKFSENEVVKDGNIITSRGPGTALAFSLSIVVALAGGTRADVLAEQMVFSG